MSGQPEEGFNLNKWVWVKLTREGRANYIPMEYNEAGNGWLRFQLWDLMANFGRHIRLGSKPLFEDNDIYFTKPKDAAR